MLTQRPSRFWTIVVGLTLATTALSCNQVTSPGHGPAHIRVFNNSAHVMDSVMVNGLLLGRVEPAAFSVYGAFETAYHYGWVRLLIDGQVRQIIPIDYVGETPLARGYYTYELSVPNAGSGLSLHFVNDSVR